MIRISVYPINCIIKLDNEVDLNHLRPWARKYTAFNEFWNKRERRIVRTPVANYVFYRKDRKQINILRTMLDDLISYFRLSGLQEYIHYTISDMSLHSSLTNLKEGNFPVLKSFITPREEQQKLLDFTANIKEGCTLIGLGTGLGKSLTSIMLASRSKKRMVVVMRPGFTGEDESSGWLKEFHKSTEVSDEEICIVKGSKSLKSLINMALADDLKYKVILISNKTIQMYLKAYEEHTDEEFEGLGWNCIPELLLNLLGTDTLFSDEVHLDSHLQCKINSYFTAKRIFGLSATYNPRDSFKKRMASFTYPEGLRYNQSKVIPYIKPTAFHFKFEKPQYIRYEGFRGYSHIKFEQSVMRHVGVYNAYKKMINQLVMERYLSRYHLYPDSKCLIVVATIKLARELAAYLQELHPDLVIRSFVENDPDENVFNSNISVSTTGSSGTGLDIPGLNTVIMTTAVSAPETNIQVAGRLRKLGDDILHDFIYFVCDDIPPHKRYDIEKKTKIFPDKLLPTVDYYSEIFLGNKYANGK